MDNVSPQCTLTSSDTGIRQQCVVTEKMANTAKDGSLNELTNDTVQSSHQSEVVLPKEKCVESDTMKTISSPSPVCSEVSSTVSKEDSIVQDNRLKDCGKSLSEGETCASQDPDNTSEIPSQSHSTVGRVASHYNAIEEIGLKERTKSRIYYMRNFNNWIKSMLIGKYLRKAKDSEVRGCPIRVLDLGCGKGGDLIKWCRGNVSHVVCADVAEVSIKHCEDRYKQLMGRQGGSPFTAQFITADCTKMRLRQFYKHPVHDHLDPTIKFHLVSCQFAFHYCFESLQQADCMMQNAAECLQNGGYFIGTIPNAYEIVNRHKAAGGNSFGNDVYQITIQECAKEYPLFGAAYDFHLHEVVDCPEFIVHFPTLVKLAEKHNLQLVEKSSFADFYKEHHNQGEGRKLLEIIKSLERYPPNKGEALLGKDEDYKDATEFLKKCPDDSFVGTLSKPEWDAVSLYMVFAFQKVKRQLSLDDYPEPSKKSKS